VECSIEPIEAEKDCTVLFEPKPDLELAFPGIKLHDSVVDLKKGRNHKVCVRVTNKCDTDLLLDNNCEVGVLDDLQLVYKPEINYYAHEKVEVKTASASDAGDNETQFEDLELSDVEERSRGFYNTLKEMQFPELSEDSKKLMKQTLWSERGAFSLHPEDIGNAPGLQLQITTTDEIPVVKNYNSIPKHLYEEVKQHVQGMLDRGWITKSKSAWCSPVVIAKKKDGTIRFCVDYRSLNSKCLPDRHPLPRIQEAIDHLQGSAWFTVVDLSKAYHQGYVSPESRDKTAFITPWGLYQWVRIPYGLRNAVAEFQRFIEATLVEERSRCALPYLDDTIIHSKGEKEHILHVKQVLQRLQTKGLKLNITKCEFAKREVTYLGRIISQNGYRMDERSVEAVRALTSRSFTTVGDVRRLVGLLSFHRRHVQGFAMLAKPLTDLLQGDAEESGGAAPSSKRVQWGPEQQNALETLVGYVTNPPILAYADFSVEFFVHCDASGVGLGAILYQVQDEETRVIAYASRTLKPSERNYHSSKLEFLALKWSVCEPFRIYLGHAPMFRVFTDNNPLVYIMSQKPNATTQRWVSELADFNFTIHYRAGKVNRDADCLSRLPLEIDKYIGLCKEETSLNVFEAMVASIQASVNEEITPAWHPGAEIQVCEINTAEVTTNIKGDQEADHYIRPILELMRSGRNWRDRAERAKLPPASRTLLQSVRRGELYLDEEGLLWRRTSANNQLVLPLKHRNLVYKALHTDMGHLGANRVLQLAQQRVYWPKMAEDIEEFTRKICRCLAQRKTRREPVAPLVSIHTSMPMELVAFDFLHLEKATSGHEYILVIIDVFTRFVQAYPTKNKSALTVAKLLFGEYILRFGLPARYLHDQGREFHNNLLGYLEGFCGIIRSRTSPYHPMTNGSCERFNSTILSMLRTLVESEKKKWPESLNKMVFAYNATKHTTTGYSPHYLFFGREPLLPLDFAFRDLPKAEQKITSYRRYIEDWESQMSEAYKIAKQNCDRVKNVAEERWKKRLIATELLPGDKVLVRNKREQGGPGKIRAYWEQSVYTVLDKKEGGVTYTVQKADDPRGEKRVLHRNMLLPCDLMEDINTETTPGTKSTQSRPVKQAQARETQGPQADDTDSEEDDDEVYWPVTPNTQVGAAIRSWEPNTEDGAATNAQELDRADDAATTTGDATEADGASTTTGDATEADGASTTTGDATEADGAATTTGDAAEADSAATTTGDNQLRRSRRAKRATAPFNYFKLGGDPIPVGDDVTRPKSGFVSWVRAVVKKTR
jgi:transposase InsO family protein